VHLGVAVVSGGMCMAWVALSNTDKPQANHVDWCTTPCCGQPRQDIVNWNYRMNFTRCQVAGQQFNDLFALISTPKFFFFLLYQLLAPMVTALSSPIDGMMRRYWADVQQFQYQLALVATAVAYLVMLVCVRGCCLQANWRVLVATSVVLSILFSSPICILTASGVVRNQYFFLLQDVFDSVPTACSFLVATLSCMTLAPKGHEGTIYGLTTTMHAIAPMLGRCISNVIYGALPMLVTKDPDDYGMLSDPQEYIEDGDDIRVVTVTALVVEMLLMLSSLLLLPMLPNDKKHVASMVSYSNNERNTCLGVITVSVVMTAILMSTTLGLFAVLPGYSCMELVGGEGCN